VEGGRWKVEEGGGGFSVRTAVEVDT
jgi:hypothetical protein